MPMFFFAGTLFPIKGLPIWVERLSEALPLTHAVRISRGLFIYGYVENFIWHFSLLAWFYLLVLDGRLCFGEQTDGGIAWGL